MKFTTSVACVALVGILSAPEASGQGCVAIRSFSSCNPNAFTNTALVGKGWLISTNYRYFRSFRHFKGTDEQEQRLTTVNPDGSLGNEVINYVNQLNLGLTYNFNRRTGLTIVLPWTYNVRSSLYEHGFKERHSMRSAGIGDIRVSVTHWLFNPDSVRKGNLALSAGVKLPTGDFDYRAFWYNVGADTNGDSIPDGEYRPVDQSIQLGDGGLGFTLELQGYLKLVGPLYGYMNGFYLLNPQDKNGTRTYRETISPTLFNETICGIPDQYMARAGVNWNVSRKWGVNLFIGGRLEGIPAYDLIGTNEGFRRPGYVESLEPGLDWMHGRHDVNISVPIAMFRNRTQSYTDKERSTPTNQVIGDAAFSDYVINLSWSVRLSDGH